MNNTFSERLRESLGADGVVGGAGALAPFVDADGAGTGLLRVLPRETEQAAETVVLAREEGLPVFSVRSRYMPEGLDGGPGILLDPERLDYVKKVDARNMMAYIGAGVTFEQLKPLLDDCGMRLLMPACARSPYVLRSYLDRDILVGEGENRHTQLSVFYAVLGDGRVWASGSHQMGEEGHADFREDQGPQLSPFFGASEDIYGIPVYGIVYLYPMREERRLLAYGFDDLESAVEFSYRVSRKEHCFELVGGDPLWWSVLSGESGAAAEGLRDELPPWTVLMSLEHRRELVEAQQGQVADEACALGGTALGAGPTGTLSSNLGRPWYLWERSAYRGAMRHVFCYSFSDRLPSALESAGSPALEAGLQDIARCFIPVYRGGAFYCETDIHFGPDKADVAAGAWRSAYEALLEQGALVDKPTGELARMVFSRARPSYLAMMRRVKRILDPDGVLNPGQLLEGM